MLAIDQRESLRQMLTAGSGRAVADAELERFKTTVVEALSSAASAVLLDRDYGLEAARRSRAPIILAADILSQSTPGGPVDRAALDDGLTPEIARAADAAALKMLVPWVPERRDEAHELAARFMDVCRAFGLPGIIEGVVRPLDIADWSDADRDDALVLAARDLAEHGPDLYKGEVPSYGTGDPEHITSVARAITESLGMPWVVLSSGVAASDFPAAVAACVAGGAEGFLAGRAIWADATRATDTATFLEQESRRRLVALAEGVHS